MQKHFLMSTQYGVETPSLQLTRKSHIYSESFACYLVSQSTHFLWLFYLLLKTISLLNGCITIKFAHFYTRYQRIVQQKLSRDTGKAEATGCGCHERYELIVWMFLNYIHYFHIHRLTPPQITEPGGSCNVHCLWLEGQLIVSLMSCV